MASHQLAAKAAADAALHNRRVTAVLSKLAALSQGERIAPSMLERLLTHDKRWASHLLLAISSSVFTEQPVKLSSVKSALDKFGSTWVLAAALDVGCVLLFEELCRTESCTLREVATHAIAVGAASAWLAPRNDIEPIPAQLAGLLHNVGVPLEWREGADKTHAAEVEPAGCDSSLANPSAEPHRPWHTWAGQAILLEGGMPAEYGEVALRHHDPDPEGLCLVVQVSDLLAQQMGCSIPGPTPNPEDMARLLVQARLPESDYAAACEVVGAAIQRATRILACRPA